MHKQDFIQPGFAGVLLGVDDPDMLTVTPWVAARIRFECGTPSQVSVR